MESFFAGLDIGSEFAELFVFLRLIFRYTWFIWISIFLYLAYQIWLYNRQLQWAGTIEYSLISVTIPSDSVKDPKSMEQVIIAMHSIEKPTNFVETYWEGRFQLNISLEIVGIEGNVRFVIRQPKVYQRSVEQFIYAYYPEAEIIEVEDYVHVAPKKYPNDTHDMWGTEIIPVKDDAYPIKTYEEFAEDIEKGFIDPIATLVETMSALRPGEQLWYQVIIRPRWDEKWKKKVRGLVDELMNRPQAPYSDWFKKSVVGGWHSLEQNIDSALGFPSAGAEEDAGPDMLLLSPGERRTIQAIENSMAKIAFFVKIRFVYLATNEAYSKVDALIPVMAFIRLFVDESLNGLMPNTKNWTSVDYFKELRLPRLKRIILGNYKSRDLNAGKKSAVMSSAEIATLYHFPYESVKAPKVEYTESKAAQPPPNLPIA